MSKQEITEAAERLLCLNPKGDHKDLDTHRIFKDAMNVAAAFLEMASEQEKEDE